MQGLCEFCLRLHWKIEWFGSKWLLPVLLKIRKNQDQYKSEHTNGNCQVQFTQSFPILDFERDYESPNAQECAEIFKRGKIRVMVESSWVCNNNSEII